MKSNFIKQKQNFHFINLCLLQATAHNDLCTE